MAAGSLEVHEFSLLTEILMKHSPDLVGRLSTLGTVPLAAEELDAFQDILGDELCQSGLRPDSEPNARGIQIEHLIDRLWHFSKEAQDVVGEQSDHRTK